MSSEVNAVPSKLESMLAIIDMARSGLDDLLRSGVAIDRQLVDSISKLASAHSNLAREAMRWSDKQKKQASSASLEERKSGVIAFITSLPLGERKLIYDALVDYERTSSPALLLRLD